MLYDLNIVWTPQTTEADLTRTLKFSQSLGYDVVALNHTFGPPIPGQVTNPIPQIGPVHSSFPQQPQPPPPARSTATISSSSSSSSSSKLPTTLRRATVLTHDPATNLRLPLLASIYDILAVRPTSEKAFTAACTNWAEISLISLDLTQHHQFRFKPKPCMAAVHRGVLFEVCYGQLVSGGGGAAAAAASSGGGGDARARATFIGNVLELFRATKGRGIVLSSGAGAGAAGGGLRAPADVINLFAVWGLGQEKGLEALDGNPRAVVINAGLSRRGFRGVVDIVEAEGRLPHRGGVGNDDGDGDDGGDGKGGQKRGADGKGKIQQKKKKDKSEPKQPGQHNPQQGGNGKRKHNEGGGEHGGVGGGDPASLPMISKRQAKKVKVAEKEQETAASTTESSK